MVFVQNGSRLVVQRNAYRYGIALFSLTRDVLDHSVDDALSRHAIKVSDTASNQALEYENIPLYLHLRVGRQVFFIKSVSFFERNIYRCAISALLQFEIIEGSIFSLFVIVAPIEECANASEAVEQSVSPARFRDTLFGYLLVDERIQFVISVLVFEKIPHIPERIGCDLVDFQRKVLLSPPRFPNVKFVPQDGSANNAEILFANLRNFVFQQKFVEQLMEIRFRFCGDLLRRFVVFGMMITVDSLL